MQCNNVICANKTKKSDLKHAIDIKYKNATVLLSWLGKVLEMKSWAFGKMLNEQ